MSEKVEALADRAGVLEHDLEEARNRIAELQEELDKQGDLGGGL
jgi:chaperonin cofactor prefoldin